MSTVWPIDHNPAEQDIWGAKLLSGLNVAHDSAGHLRIPEVLRRYVDYVNGSDSNDGRYPYRAFKTIAAGYAALITASAGYTRAPGGLMGVGVLHLAPGDHDVSGGFVVGRTNSVELDGTLSGYNRPNTGNFQARIVTSSTTATEMILTGSTTQDVTYGNTFRNLAFAVAPGNAGLTACIRARGNDHLVVEYCNAWATDSANHNVYLLEQAKDPFTDDNAWLRMAYCNTSSLPLYHLVSGVTNQNRSLFLANLSFFGGSVPMFHAEGDLWDAVVIGNNFEGGAGAPHVKLGSTTNGVQNCLFAYNSGESATSTYPFYDLFRGGGNEFRGGSCTARDGGIGTWLQIESAATVGIAGTNGGNLCYKADAVLDGVTSFKKKYVDLSDKPFENRLQNRSGVVLPVKSGTAPTLSDSDFYRPPADGAPLGMTINTTTGEKRIWYRLNGQYLSNVIA